MVGPAIPTASPDPLITLIELANSEGYRINNLCQLSHSGGEEQGWRANLTDSEGFYEFGLGPTAHAALADALDKARRKEGEVRVKLDATSYSIEGKKTAEEMGL